MNKLKQLRKAARISQAALAKRSRISQPQIARMEHEPDHPNYRTISPEHARRLAPILKTTVYELTGSLDAAALGLDEKEIARIGRWIDSIRVEQ